MCSGHSAEFTPKIWGLLFGNNNPRSADSALVVISRSFAMKPKHLLITGILALLGWLGIPPAVRWVQAYTAQKQALEQSPSLLSEVGDVSQSKDVERLKAQQQRLQTTIRLLEEIPNLPTFGYQEAQERLKQLRPVAAVIDQRLAAETEASGNFKRALDLDAQALQLANNPPHPEERLRQAADKWREAVQLLEKIPAQSPSYQQAQEGLKPLREKQRQVEKWLTNEKQAVRKMETVLTTAKQAANITQNKSSLNLATLLNASAQWTRTVQFLKEIPENTTVSEDAKTFLPIAERNLRRVQGGIEQLKQCQTLNTAFGDVCGYSVALETEEFPIQVVSVVEKEQEGSEDTQEVVVQEVLEDSTISMNDDSYLQRYREHRLRRFPKILPSETIGSAGTIGALGSTGTGDVNVRSYTRSNGTVVRSYTRSRSSSRVGGFGSGRSSGGG